MAVDDVYTKVLLHMDGADAATTFTDESGLTWTRRGDAQIDTAQSVFGGASGLFDGAGDYIDTPDSATWILDDGSDANLWTIDFRVRFNGDPGTAERGFCGQDVGDGANYWHFNLNGNALIFKQRASGVNTIVISNAWNPADATWYHIALVKNGSSGYMMFVDGTQIGATQTDTSLMANFAAVFTVGLGSGVVHNGWMDEFRLSKGIARWTANFTPPIAAYTDVPPSIVVESASFTLTGTDVNSYAIIGTLSAGSGSFTLTFTDLVRVVGSESLPKLFYKSRDYVLSFGQKSYNLFYKAKDYILSFTRRS